MSTPTPTEPTFDPHDFPQKLRDAQRRAAELYAEIRTLQARLPWSREPHPGWPADTERGRERAGREASPGWDPADAAAYDTLRGELLDVTAYVHSHGWWKTCRDHGVTGAALVDVRQALKSAHGAVPLGRGDVDTAA